MIDHLSRKAASGDLYVNRAMQYLQQHEWGRAMMAIESAIAKGCLSDEPEAVTTLLLDWFG